MSSWETPSFVEVDMSAEIGGYQGEDDRPAFPDYDPAYLQDSARASKPDARNA
jgi:hypothetical protein